MENQVEGGLVESDEAVGIRLPVLPKPVLDAIAERNENLLKSGKHRLRRMIVDVLFEELIKHTQYPSHQQYCILTALLIRRYPFLKDKRGNGYATWLESLKTRFKFERRQMVDPEVLEKKRKFGQPHPTGKRIPPSTVSTISKINRKIADPAIVLEEGEDAESCRNHHNFIKTEMKKSNPKWVAVKERMKKSYFDRKQRMKTMTVTDALESFPWMREEKLICYEMKLMTGKNVQPALQRKAAATRTKILSLAKKLKRGTQFLDFLKTNLDEGLDEADESSMLSDACIGVLPFLFNEDISLFCCYKDHVTDGNPVLTPRIIFEESENVLTKQQINIYMENVVVCEGKMKLTEAVAVLLSIYFIYEVAYPAKLKNTLEFIQYFFLDLESSRKIGLPTMRMINMIEQTD